MTTETADPRELLEAAWELMSLIEEAGASWLTGREAWREQYRAHLQAATAEPEPAAPGLPEGVYARIELPGYRKHTGWVTEETRFGAQMAMVRDWDGQVIAEVFIGPGCQLVRLPTPLKRPEPRVAITAGLGGYLALDGDRDDDVFLDGDGRPC